jgi:hypothetical protein
MADAKESDADDSVIVPPALRTWGYVDFPKNLLRPLPFLAPRRAKRPQERLKSDATLFPRLGYDGYGDGFATAL